MRLLICAALSAAVLFAVSGCGSDEPSGSQTVGPVATATTTKTSATTTSKTTTTAADPADARKAYLKKVNPICEDYNSEVRKVQADLQAVGKTGNVDVYAEPLKRATKAAKKASRRFDDVEPPAAEAAQAALIGRALKAQVTGNQLLLQAAEADDPQQFGVATQALQQVTPKLQAAMREFGMTVCGAAG
jgi:hypothetical protein